MINQPDFTINPQIMDKKLKVHIARDGENNGKTDGKLLIHLDSEKPAYADDTFYSRNPTGIPNLFPEIKNGECFEAEIAIKLGEKLGDDH